MTDDLKPFQARVAPWMDACFGPEISGDVTERNHRFLEEALELVQAKGCTAGEAHQLVEYVFSRPIGEPHQEVGGVMVTLAALCLAAGLDMDRAANDELARIWTCVEKIRAKQAEKPRSSPLPVAIAAWNQRASVQEAALSQNDLYYLRAIGRRLDEFQSAMDGLDALTIGGEALHDERDWLECFIDQHTRAIAEKGGE